MNILLIITINNRSQLVHDASLQPSLVRVLQFLPRRHDLAPPPADPRVAELLSRVGRKVFLVFVREGASISDVRTEKIDSTTEV